MLDTILEEDHPRIISAKFEIGCPLPNLCPVNPTSNQDGRQVVVTKNRNFFKWPKLLYFKPECAQI
jgi:hypothetical protein